jgi:hypothetical protein
LGVVWAEDRVTVLGWTEEALPGAPTMYVAQIDRQA